MAHSARIYDYILGGKDNFEADRKAAEAAVKANPTIATGPNMHEIAQSLRPDRSREEFGRFVDGLELVPPGLVPMTEWRADSEPGPRPSVTEAGAYAALGRKP